ncbi:MAG: hypothetical protein RIQ71_1203 [Verrucomicrobiota bacterium]|jgi:hypothetical protein
MVALANFNPIWFVRRVRLLLACLVVCFATPRNAIGAPKELRPPPMGETISVEVMRGGSRQITLKAFEGRGNPLGYEMVTQPHHGKLEDFQQADGNRQGFASVTYAHRNDEESKEDEFTFRARALIGGGVSSPIKVKVRIIDAPPKLQITRAVDFSAAAGESDLQQIILVNEGGGMLEGRVAPKEPFHVEGEGHFSLGRGRMTNIVIRFSPQSTDAVAPQTLSPAPADPSAKIILRGVATAPFSAGAEPMEVLADGERAGTIAITNLSTSPLVLDIDIEPKGIVDAPATAKIREGETARIALSIGANKKGGDLSLRICVRNPHYSQEFATQAPAVPAEPELLTPLLDFREKTEANLSVTNSGGLEARFSLELPENIKPAGGAVKFAVAPGKVTNVQLNIDGTGDTSGKTAYLDLGRKDKIPVAVLWPARLQVLTKSLDFRSTPEAEIVVENCGDVAGSLSLNLPRGIRQLDEAEGVVVSARSQTKLRLGREQNSNLPAGIRVIVELGRDGKIGLPVISTRSIENEVFAWQLNKDVKLEQSADGKVSISWATDKQGWTNAQLEVVQEGAATVYQPSIEDAGWWAAMKAWWSDKIERVRKTIDGQRNFFKTRTKMPGEGSENEVSDAQAQPAWNRMGIPAQDYENSAMIWRVSAEAIGSGERKQASAEFRLGLAEKLLLSVQETVTAPSNQGPAVPLDQPIWTISRKSEGNDLMVTFALSHGSEDTQFAVERITGFRGSRESDTGGVCYATTKLPQSIATVANIGFVSSAGMKLRTVTVRFKNLQRGSAMLCRLVPTNNPTGQIPSAPFLIEGPPARRFPWRWLLTTAAAMLVSLLIWPRLRAMAN